MFMQVSYAACDALAAVLIFVAMVRMKATSSETDDYLAIAAKAKSLCQGVIDLKYSGRISDHHTSAEKVSWSQPWCIFSTFYCRYLPLLTLCY